MRNVCYNVLIQIMNPIMKLSGPDMNRDTEKNVAAAGFKINKIELHYLDIVKSIYASKSSL